MLYNYSITLKDAKGQLKRLQIVAPNRAKAEAKAYELAGTPPTEPENCLRQEPVDAVVTE